MKFFTKSALALLLLCMGVMSTNARVFEDKTLATFESPSGIDWEASTKTFSWSSQWGNQLHNIGLPSGDITGYEKLVVDCEILSGEGYRFMFYATTQGNTAGGTTVITTSGKHEFLLSDFDMDADYLEKCSEICLSGYNGSGSVKVNSVYLVKGYVDATDATFESPSGINWEASTKTFSWSSQWGNQLHNIGLPSGDITGYEKLVVDCEILSGEGYRFMFYATTQGNTAGGLTVITTSGKHEFLLSDFDMDADYLKKCSEICLSGYNGSGSVKVNSVYLANSVKTKSLTFETPVYCAAKWIEETMTFNWGTGGYNSAWTFMAAKDISGDITEWTGLHLKVSDFTNSVENKLKVIFKSGGQDGPTSEFTVVPDAEGNIEIDLTNAGGNCDFTNVFDVTIYGLDRTDPSIDGSVKVTEAWLCQPADPLALPKKELEASIAAGEKQSAIGRTAASFAALTDAISDAKNALADANATEESLAAAKAAVDGAIAALELAEGYTPLTADMFKHWDDNLNPVVGTPASCAFNLNTSTGQAFGDNTVRYLYFADLSCYDKLILYVSEGTPRIMLNRKDPGNGGGDANGGSYIELTDDPVGGAVVVDLEAYEFAHLNAIKGKNGGNVTITGIVLQERVFHDPLLKGPDGKDRDWIGLNRKWVRDAIANAEKIDLSQETDEELIYNLRRAIAIARKVAYTRCDPANPDAIIAAMDAARRDLKAAVEAFQKEEASDVERVYATFENPSNTNTTWNAATKTFTWSTTYYNQLRNIGLPNGNISKYRKLVVNCTMNQGDRIRILFYKGGSNLTLYAHDGVNEFIIKDELEKLAPNDYNEYLLQCDEICLSGDNGSAPGEAVINSVYLETYSTATEKVFATFENPSNTNTTWNAETKTFTWSTTWYNQLRNIGLPNGDISKYKKLVVNCTMNQGDRFRILFYKGGSNLTLYAHDGINEFLIKDELEKLAPNDYNEYLLQCDEICLSGDNATAPGEAVINSVYLETYPATEVVDIPAIVEEQDPGKPEGSFVDLTASMFTGGTATMNLGKKIGNGELVYGLKSKDAFADLSNYAKLTIVATPGLKLVFNLNHEVDIKENQGDYSADDSGKYVWIDATVGENGIYELDLTQYGSAKLNNIRMPWDNSNKGTVWYLLLSAEAQTGRTATGVSEVKLNSDNAEIYNLNGQRVAAPQKGLNIINGKKVVIK